MNAPRLGPQGPTARDGYTPAHWSELHLLVAMMSVPPATENPQMPGENRGKHGRGGNPHSRIVGRNRVNEVVALLSDGVERTSAQVARDLGISHSGAHRALRRAGCLRRRDHPFILWRLP